MDALLLRVDLKVCTQLRVRPLQSVQIGNPSSTVLVYFLWLLLVLPPSLSLSLCCEVVYYHFFIHLLRHFHITSSFVRSSLCCGPLPSTTRLLISQPERIFFFFSDLEISMRVRDRLSQWWWLRCSLTSLASLFRLHSKFFPFQFFFWIFVRRFITLVHSYP